MFFKMLKNDLKAQKGLYAILFFFIIGASVVSVIAAVMMYNQFVGIPKTERMCNVANIITSAMVGMGSFDEKKEKLEEWIENSPKIREGELKEFVRIQDEEFYVNGIYASDPQFPSHKSFQMTTGTQKVGLRYNEENRLFAVESGCMAISKDLSVITGIKEGDTIRITTQMGNLYHFTVSEIYRTASRNSEELIISDADYEKLKTEEPYRFVKMMLRSKDISYGDSINEELTLTGLVYACGSYEYSPKTDSDYTILVIISWFLSFMGLVILSIMLIMIRYMMLAAIKREEKEIGMMRAIGVDSLRYRWMFASVYICFAFIGGGAGIGIGGPVSRYMMEKMCRNVIQFDPYLQVKITLLVSLVMVLAILLFSLIMMRRVKKVSVMEAIRGSNIGERVEQFKRIDLYRSKRSSVPLFLAFSDIINTFGKYIFLIVAYMLAALLLLSAFNLKSTLISHEYHKHFLILKMDIWAGLSSEQADYYYQKGGDTEGAYREFCKDAREAGIPLNIRFMKEALATMELEGKDHIPVKLMYGDTYNEVIPLRKGGELPVHENEIILSYYTAKTHGIQIGDQIKMIVNEFEDEGMQYRKKEVEQEFLVCGFFDIMEDEGAVAIAGCEYSGGSAYSYQLTEICLDAPKSEHAAYLEKLKERFGPDYFMDAEEYFRNNMSYVTGPIDAIKLFLSLLLAFILVLTTTLYSTVDLAIETPGIAILKTCGFSDRDIRKWHMWRMLTIIGIAMVLAYILEYTVVDQLLGWICEGFANTGVHFVSKPVEVLLIVPLLILGIGCLASIPGLRKIKHIDIRNIRED